MEALKQSLHTYAESLRGQHATRIEIATELDRLAASIADADSRPAAQPGVVKGMTIDDVERIIIETEPVSMSDKGDRIWTRRMAVALAEKLAASPAPSLPEDVEASAAFLNEAARYFENCPAKGEDRAFWATVHNAGNCRKAAALIRSLSSQLAEANERYAREAHAKMVALEQLAEARAEIERLTPLAVAYDYLESPAGREMAEADRDRLAADNERLREICRMLRDSYEPRTGTYALGELHQARESARAALASLEERT